MANNANRNNIFDKFQAKVFLILHAKVAGLSAKSTTGEHQLYREQVGAIRTVTPHDDVFVRTDVSCQSHHKHRPLYQQCIITISLLKNISIGIQKHK